MQDGSAEGDAVDSLRVIFDREYREYAIPPEAMDENEERPHVGIVRDAVSAAGENAQGKGDDHRDEESQDPGGVLKSDPHGFVLVCDPQVTAQSGDGTAERRHAVDHVLGKGGHGECARPKLNAQCDRPKLMKAAQGGVRVVGSVGCGNTNVGGRLGGGDEGRNHVSEWRPNTEGGTRDSSDTDDLEDGGTNRFRVADESKGGLAGGRSGVECSVAGGGAGAVGQYAASSDWCESQHF